MCKNCESTNRIIWPPGVNKPELILLVNGNYISLKKCIYCNSLWVESPYEPYLSFVYLVRWKYSKDTWEYINDLENSKYLLEWHKQEIKANWLELSIKEQSLIEEHRKRSYYQYNPIDMEVIEVIDIEKLLFSSKK